LYCKNKVGLPRIKVAEIYSTYITDVGKKSFAYFFAVCKGIVKKRVKYGGLGRWKGVEWWEKREWELLNGEYYRKIW
jgi:hypothetical protein